MRSLRLVTLALVAIAASVAFLSGAPPAEARTTGYHIWNFTAEAVRVSDIQTLASPRGERVFSNDSDAPKPPRVNQLVQPGEQLHIELENPFSYTRRANLALSAGESGYSIQMDNYFGGKCAVTQGNRQCSVEGGRIELLEPRGSVHRVSAKDIQTQAQVLKTFCTEANNCEFEPLETIEAEVTKNAVGNSLTNCFAEGGPDDDTTIESEDKVAISDSVGIESETSFTVFKVFKESISIKYKHERTDTHTFKQNVHVVVPPQYIGWVAATVPVIRDLGEFKLNLGNTKWILEDVAFDSPDASRKGNFAARYEKMTPEKYRATCEESKKALAMAPGSTLLLTPLALVQTNDSGTAIADLMRGGPESNSLRGLGGRDLIRGGGGHDTLLGGAGRDLIKGGPGEDRIDAGPGPDRVDDNAGPTTVTTGANASTGADRVDVA
ncbi:MAG: hypothetical protein WA862_00600, partial [Solirubrobacterales bacterium]